MGKRKRSVETVGGLMAFDISFFRGKRVLVTGHTGFKGTWLCRVLLDSGADLIGYSRCSEKAVSLFELTGIEKEMIHVKGDVRDLRHLHDVFEKYRPEIVFHLAAQPIVRVSYAEPVYTYDVNVMGTVNMLECSRLTSGVRSVVNVTTDKVYKNREWERGYQEGDELDGYDPYSNSKSCSELVTQSYRRSFFAESGQAVSTARAGNVIGGGDFSPDRIIPDCVRAAVRGDDIVLRNPYSVRPYQHVLDPVFGYLTIAAAQWDDPSLADCYNIGPDQADCLRTGELADLFVREWGNGLRWVDRCDGGPHEAGLLMLDCTKMRTTLGWNLRWGIEEAVRKTVEWSKCWYSGGDVNDCMKKQIAEYLETDTIR